MVMLVVGFLQWWYGAGWKRQFTNWKNRLAGVYDYFSIDLLVKSWFAPFRQISAGRVEGPLSVRWSAFVDKTISRFIGAFMRTVLILIGLLSLLVTVVLALVGILGWLIVPALPIVGLILTLSGVYLWKA